MELGKFNDAVSISNIGIKSLNSVYYNLNEPALMQEAILRKEGRLGLGGALLVETGKHTGRSPKDKFVVNTNGNEDTIWWEKNGRLSSENFSSLYRDMLEHMKG